jgi:hypothetical protein
LSSPRFPEVKGTVSASRRHLARPVGQVLVDAVVGEALLVRRVFAQPAFWPAYAARAFAFGRSRINLLTA